MEPELYARALLERLKVTGVPDIHQIAAALDVPIYERALEGCEGMLVRVKGTAKGAIAVKSSIREDTRKRFTVAHELGHLLLPAHDEFGVCPTEAIESWAKDLRDKEREANAFAAELLMPSRLVLESVAQSQPGFGLIERVAETFTTSLTASGYRFVGLTSEAVALVWSQASQMRWAKRSEEFSGWLRLREALDSRTLAADLFRGGRSVRGMHHVPADAWLETANAGATILEESRFLPNYNAVLTLLWLNDPDTSRDDDELLRELEPSEFSTRRTRWPR